jgi:hypothetical protein
MEKMYCTQILNFSVQIFWNTFLTDKYLTRYVQEHTYAFM